MLYSEGLKRFGGPGSGRHPEGVKVDEDALKSTIRNGLIIRQPNTEIQQTGDKYKVQQRIGVDTPKTIASGFESREKALDFINSHNGLILNQTTGPAIDENQDELEDDTLR